MSSSDKLVEKDVCTNLLQNEISIEPTTCKPDIIKAINRDTVHKICSGQVVLSLSIAIKELLENSIDAKATNIEIRLKESGSEYISVSDNGTGVEEHNFEALTLKHHTSKLQEFSDLYSVETFGFRGEALSSLCSLANLTVITRHSSSLCGTTIKYDFRGNISKKSPCSRQQGTTVILENLFASLPVRRKEFLRNLKKEFTKMIQIVQAYCIISSGVRIRLVNLNKKNETIITETFGSQSMIDNISCVFGIKQIRDLLKFDEKYKSDDNGHNNFSLEGYISSCGHNLGRSSPDRQFYFINSRPCDPSKISKLINEVYHQYNRHQYPFVSLNINMDRGSVDVNLTPDKRKILLDQEKLFLETLRQYLVQMYQNIPSICISISKSPTKSGKNSLTLTSLQNFAHSTQISKTKNSKFENLSSPPAKRKCINQNKIQNFLNVLEKKEEESETNLSNETDQLNNSNIDHKITIEQKLSPKTNNHVDKYKNEINSENLIKYDDSLDITHSEISEHFNKKNRFTIKNCDKLNENEIKIKLENNSEVKVEHFNEYDENNSNIENLNEDMSLEEEYNIDECPKISNKKRSTITIQVDIDKIKALYKNNSNNFGENKDISVKFRATIDPKENNEAEHELTKFFKKESFSKMKVIGQFNLGFIISKLDQDLFIVDQHATDEKYNFEKLEKETKLQHQPLVIPQTLELTFVNENIIIENISIFKQNGFDFEIDENGQPMKRVKLIGIPMSKNWHFGKEDIDEMIFMLQDSPNTICRPSRVRDMLASRACRKSVMVGTALTISQMHTILHHMADMDQPWNCPHGRPTMRHLINLNMLVST